MAVLKYLQITHFGENNEGGTWLSATTLWPVVTDDSTDMQPIIEKIFKKTTNFLM